MRTRFIKVDNISEVDPSKITVHDLNNRYIDRQGSMFGLRYNRISKKVEIIKLIRTPAKSAEYFHHKLKHQKKNDVSDVRTEKGYFEHDEGMDLVEDVSSGDGLEEEIESDFNADVFIDNAIVMMQTHAVRLNGIMSNIKNSRVVPEGDRVNAGQLEEILRNLSIDGIQKIDKIIATHKELKEFPRSLSYYLAKQSSKSKAVIDQLNTDSRKMEFIYLAEMYYSISNLYRGIIKVLGDLNYFLENTHVEEIRDLTFSEKQSYQDACISVENTAKECDKLLKDMKKIEKILSDPKNF